MKAFIHKGYVLLGTVLCNLRLLFWRLRDWVNPPKTDSVLFVSHPDDDTLFFHTFIKEHKPYVCLMTTGWSLRRMPCFFKVMKHYGVRYRAYPLGTNDSRLELQKRIVRNVLNVGDFTLAATHNETGEYGHEEHKRVHQAVAEVLSEDHRTVLLLCPEDKSNIAAYPLPDCTVEEKEMIFRTMYTTEAWVLNEDREWVINEHVTCIDIGRTVHTRETK